MKLILEKRSQVKSASQTGKRPTRSTVNAPVIELFNGRFTIAMRSTVLNGHTELLNRVISILNSIIDNVQFRSSKRLI